MHGFLPGNSSPVSRPVTATADVPTTPRARGDMHARSATAHEPPTATGIALPVDSIRFDSINLLQFRFRVLSLRDGRATTVGVFSGKSASASRRANRTAPLTRDLVRSFLPFCTRPATTGGFGTPSLLVYETRAYNKIQILQSLTTNLLTIFF
jgi:hypothetical protein